GALLALYVVWDTRQYRHEPAATRRRDIVDIEPLRLRGGLNALPLVLVIVSVAFLRAPWREIVMVACAAVSLWRTPAPIRPGAAPRGPPVTTASPPRPWSKSRCCSSVSSSR